MYIFLLQIQHFRLNKELYGGKKKKTEFLKKQVP